MQVDSTRVVVVDTVISTRKTLKKPSNLLSYKLELKCKINPSQTRNDISKLTKLSSNSKIYKLHNSDFKTPLCFKLKTQKCKLKIQTECNEIHNHTFIPLKICSQTRSKGPTSMVKIRPQALAG